MTELKVALIFAISSFILIYLIYYYGILKRKYKKYLSKKKTKKKSDLMNQMEISYLVSKFNLDVNKINFLILIRIIALIDAFIISFTSSFVYYLPFKGIIWKFLIGFVMLFILIYALYEILGRILVKKGWIK